MEFSIPAAIGLAFHSTDIQIYAVLLIVLVVFATAFFASRRLRNISFTKHVKAENENAKVYLQIKNVSKGSIGDLTVHDFIPTTMNLTEFDTMEAETEETKNGTRLKWHIDRLDAGEDRLFAYNVENDMESDVTMTFPKAEFESGDVRIAETSEIRRQLKNREST